jgi:hypothetical protein
MSGIEFNAFEDDDWIVQLVDFVRDWHGKTQKPMFGACFGHQIIARAMGSRVGRSDKGWEVSVCEIELSKAGEELFGKNNLVCLSISAFSFFVRDLLKRDDDSLYNKCTATSSTTYLPALSIWVVVRCARSKDCISQAGC